MHGCENRGDPSPRDAQAQSSLWPRDAVRQWWHGSCTRNRKVVTMSIALSLFLVLLFQTPQPTQTVLVGLADGQRIVMQDPDFTGFIQGHAADAVLIYQHPGFHGEMPLSKISRIEFGLYKKGEPF